MQTETLRYENFVPPSPSCRERRLGLWTDQYCRKGEIFDLSPKNAGLREFDRLPRKPGFFANFGKKRNQGGSSSYSIETFPDLFHNIMTRLFQILLLFSVLTGATAADAADGRRQRRRMNEDKKSLGHHTNETLVEECKNPSLISKFIIF